jgi:hypothetical protein
MPDYRESYPILFGRQLDITVLDRLYKEYLSLRMKAPRRTLCGKEYFVGHDGTTSAKRQKKPSEDLIAIALWNLQHNWTNPLGGSFRFLDYQFPLQTQQTDLGIGKVDILGINDEGRLIITELKVDAKSGKPNDNPSSALLQGLRYAAIIEVNLKEIAGEARVLFGVEIKQLPPVVQLLATEKWWKQQGFDLTVPNNFQEKFSLLIDRIESKIDVRVECLAFNYSNSAFRWDSKKPQLALVPTLRSVLH